MSPASSGHLEVERYIGACLISQHRTKNATKRNDFYNREYVADGYQNNYLNLDNRYHQHIQRCNTVDGWAGGMPLISFANQQRRNRQQQQQQINEKSSMGARVPVDDCSPLARLAVHTQGAPLILTKTYNHRKNKVNRNGKTVLEKSKVVQTNQNVSSGGGGGGVDTVSVASDESSSGSTNSENCLPRIIKPRKRRKKDRKPPLLNRPLSQDGFSTDSASPDIDLINFQTFLPVNFPFDSYIQQQQQQQFVPQQQNFYDRYRIFNDNSETPKLHHSFEDIEEIEDGKDINGNQPTSVCQCRYCDPSGQIWDVDRNCYSPFLTPPTDTKMFQFPLSNINLNMDYLSQVSRVEDENLVKNMSTMALDNEVMAKKTTTNVLGPREVEVSTEIVTSLNGHRDLEIKFFSTATNENVVNTSKDHHHSDSKNDDDDGGDCELNCVNKCKLKSEE